MRRRARSVTRSLVRRGKLQKLPCVICGNPHSEIHHPDYNQPRLVIWLCPNHHREHHRHQRRAA